MPGLERLRLSRDEPPLHNGFIADPVGKTKSVVLTEKGLAESKRLFETMFVNYGGRAGNRGHNSTGLEKPKAKSKATKNAKPA